MSRFFINHLKQLSKQKWTYALGGLLIRRGLKGLTSNWDARKIGCAPLLGIAKPVFIGHGNSDAQSVVAAVGTMLECLNRDVNQHVMEEIRQWG